LVEGLKRVTKSLDNDEWLFERGINFPLIKKQRLFLTRGHKYTGVFSFPAAVLKTIHRQILRRGYHISLGELRKCTFVLEVRGLKIGNEWLNFAETYRRREKSCSYIWGLGLLDV